MSFKLLLSQVKFVNLDPNLKFGITDGDIFHFVDKDALDVV